MTMTNRLYEQAVEKWGLPLQYGMLMEECAELIKATNKVQRMPSQKNYSQLAEEMADVLIMIGQIQHILHLKGQVAACKEQKIIRLQELIEGLT